MSLNVSMLAPYISRRAGGLMDSVKNLSRFLENEHDIKVDVISVEDEFSTEDRVRWGDLSLHLVAPKYARFRYAPELSHRLASLTPDLVHTHGIWTYLSVATVGWSKSNDRITSRPYLVSTHGMLDPWALHNSRWKKIMAAFVFERRHLENAACIHAVNNAEAAAIRTFGLRNPICVIPNGIEVHANNAADRVPPWAADMVGSRKVLLYLGRLHPKKGLSILLRGWKEASKREKGWVLVIAGWDQGGHRGELEQLVRELKITDSVQFAGPLFGEERETAYQNANAFILPSLSEGQPLVVLEAWSHARAVLMTPECNLPEGFQKRAAIRMNTTVEGASEGLRRLFALDGPALQEMGRRGRDLVIANFSWPQIASQMFAVYNWLLGRSAVPDCVLLD
ncbi:MAG TPA: glycosyltransferase [Pyrinomonadaceae bacterium]|nr:glycosyltransferase [Pyrinomonadaceae bacterium]